MTITDAHTEPAAKLDLEAALADLVCGTGVLERAISAGPAAAALYDQLKAFVDGPHGQAIAAYWRAWDNVEARGDWATDVAMQLIADVDAIMYGIVGLLEDLNPSYTESGTRTATGWEETRAAIERVRAVELRPEFQR